MSQDENSGMGRIYIKVGSDIIDLTGSAKEVNDGWLKIKEDGSWAANLSAIRNARELACRSGCPKGNTKWNT